PDSANMIPQSREECQLTNNVDRVIDFKNTILFMTTNIGAQEITGKERFGFTKKDEASSYEKMKETLKVEMEKNFRPEFLNRVDDIIVFRGLTKADLKNIIDIELTKVFKRLKEKNLTMVLTEEAKELLIDGGSSLDFAA